MKPIVNYHIIDPKNIGDFLSSPLNYFEFPGYEVSQIDLRTLDEARATDDARSPGAESIGFSIYQQVLHPQAPRRPVSGRQMATSQTGD